MNTTVDRQSGILYAAWEYGLAGASAAILRRSAGFVTLRTPGKRVRDIRQRIESAANWQRGRLGLPAITATFKPGNK